MRALLVVMCAMVTPACVSTEPETPAGHPANATAPGPPSDFDTAVLRAGFDPFERYEALGTDSGEAPPAHEGHGAHSGHAGSAPQPSTSSDGGAAPAGASYTCPMHPEIVRPEPGRCPKCGMKLVPKKADPK